MWPRDGRPRWPTRACFPPPARRARSAPTARRWPFPTTAGTCTCGTWPPGAWPAQCPASRYCAGPCRVAFSPDGTLLAVGGGFPRTAQPSIYLWDLAAGRWAGTLREPGGTIATLAFARNGILAVGADDDSVYLWDVAARSLTGTIAPPVNAAAGNDSISKGSGDGGPYPGPGDFDRSTTAAFSPDGTTLAIDASFGYGTYLYRVATRKQIAALTDPGGQFRFAAQVVFSPDGTMLAVTDHDPSGHHGHAYLWDVTRNRR